MSVRPGLPFEPGGAEASRHDHVLPVHEAFRGGSPEVAYSAWSSGLTAIIVALQAGQQQKVPNLVASLCPELSWAAENVRGGDGRTCFLCVPSCRGRTWAAQ